VIRIIADEDFNNDVLRGLQARLPDLDVVRVQDEMPGATDLQNLDWAAKHHRIILTHDFKTRSDFYKQRIKDGLPTSGLILVQQNAPVGMVIEHLLRLLNDIPADYWSNRIEYVTRGRAR